MVLGFLLTEGSSTDISKLSESVVMAKGNKDDKSSAKSLPEQPRANMCCKIEQKHAKQRCVASDFWQPDWVLMNLFKEEASKLAVVVLAAVVVACCVAASVEEEATFFPPPPPPLVDFLLLLLLPLCSSCMCTPTPKCVCIMLAHSCEKASHSAAQAVGFIREKTRARRLEQEVIREGSLLLLLLLL